MKVNANVMIVDEYRSAKRCPCENEHYGMQVYNATANGGGMRSLRSSGGCRHVLHRDVVGSLWIGMIALNVVLTGERPPALRKPMI